MPEPYDPFESFRRARAAVPAGVLEILEKADRLRPMVEVVQRANDVFPAGFMAIDQTRHLAPAFMTSARADDAFPAALKVMGPARVLPPGFMRVACPQDALSPVLRAIMPTRELSPVLKAIMPTRELSPVFSMLAGAHDALPPRFLAAVGPVGMTTADARRLHSLTSRYATALAYPTALPSLSVREQAEHLEPPTASLMVAVAAKPDPAAVFERAGEHGAEIVMLLSTLVAWTQQQERRPGREHLLLVVATATAIYQALTGTLQLFGYEQLVRALEALGHALQRMH
jgi:hypothetical protein